MSAFTERTKSKFSPADVGMRNFTLLTFYIHSQSSLCSIVSSSIILLGFSKKLSCVS